MSDRADVITGMSLYGLCSAPLPGEERHWHQSTVQWQLLLEVGIENFDVHERGFRDWHSFRSNAQ